MDRGTERNKARGRWAVCMGSYSYLTLSPSLTPPHSGLCLAHRHSMPILAQVYISLKSFCADALT